MIKPSIGRAVWYYPDGKRQLDAGAQPCSAHVAYVHGDRMVNIGYLTHGGIALSMTSVVLVQEGDEIPDGPFCCWMPFQINAAKQEARGGAV